MSPTPPPSTATVPVASAPSCAAASMPRARPETTTRPGRAQLRGQGRGRTGGRPPRRCAPRPRPRARRCSSAGSPRAQISGGGGSMALRPSGKVGSQAASSSRAHAPRQRPARLRLGERRDGGGLERGRRGGPVRGSAASAAPAEPKRRIRCWKATGPTLSVARQTQPVAPLGVREARPLTAWRRGLGADARLLALEQAADVLVVADEDQHRHEHRQPELRSPASAPARKT